MGESEGVIKYRLDYRAAPAVATPGWAELNAWRSLLWRLQLIGLDPARYGGLGYGNLSLRQDGRRFLVTGTQTGHLPHLAAEHYVQVLQADPAQNFLQAEGPLPPSSEALSHAAVYAASPQARCVVHGHCPEIWQRAENLGLPCVTADIAYGTPAMAAAVSAMAAAQPEQGLLAMLGHQDGLLAWGVSPEQACLPLLRCLAQALASTNF